MRPAKEASGGAVTRVRAPKRRMKKRKVSPRIGCPFQTWPEPGSRMAEARTRRGAVSCEGLFEGQEIAGHGLDPGGIERGLRQFGIAEQEIGIARRLFG